MSGPIQRMIGPANARLLRYLKEAAPLLSVPVEEKTIIERKFQIEELIKRMNTNICLLERCNRDLASLLKEFEGDEWTKEEEEHQKVTEGSEGFIEVLLDAGKNIVHLGARFKIITKSRGQMRTDKNSQGLVPQTPSLGYHLD